MQKKICVLGSTGSIGTQTLEVAKNLSIDAVGITAGSNIDLLEAQSREWRPKIVAMQDAKLADELRVRLERFNIKVYGGEEGIVEVATIDEADTVVAAIVGIAGLRPTLEAIRCGKNIALANKETLVTAGQIVMPEAQKNNVSIFPVDSEHAAIFQCLLGNNKKDISRLIITASGGPFFGKSLEELKNITPQQALRHPNWKMGPKITIDSATLMNKGLEVIEASWLFGIPPEKIEVVIHPESIIHSMVEYVDGTVMAQMGIPDMRIPIQLALTYPERSSNLLPKLDFPKVGNLTFKEPDFKTFRCLQFAYDALNQGGVMPTVLNAANEVAVEAFLKGKIGFLDIPDMIDEALSSTKNYKGNPDENKIDTLRQIDCLVRSNLKTRLDKNY